MFKTKNDLPEESRTKAVELLNARLANYITCRRSANRPTGTLRGRTSSPCMRLFDQVNEAVEDYVDDIAERAVNSAAWPRGRCAWWLSDRAAGISGEGGGRPQPR